MFIKGLQFQFPIMQWIISTEKCLFSKRILRSAQSQLKNSRSMHKPNEPPHKAGTITRNSTAKIERLQFSRGSLRGRMMRSSSLRGNVRKCQSLSKRTRVWSYSSNISRKRRRSSCQHHQSDRGRILLKWLLILGCSLRRKTKKKKVSRFLTRSKLAVMVEDWGPQRSSVVTKNSRET